jgi:hypothetical protein
MTKSSMSNGTFLIGRIGITTLNVVRIEPEPNRHDRRARAAKHRRQRR